MPNSRNQNSPIHGKGKISQALSRYEAHLARFSIPSRSLLTRNERVVLYCGIDMLVNHVSRNTAIFQKLAALWR